MSNKYVFMEFQTERLKNKAKDKEWLEVAIEATDKCIEHWIEDCLEKNKVMRGDECDYCINFHDCDSCLLFIIGEYCHNRYSLYFDWADMYRKSKDNNKYISEVKEAGARMVDALMAIRKVLIEELN